jgi:DNA-binding CsgD family transcriptional regulator
MAARRSGNRAADPARVWCHTWADTAAHELDATVEHIQPGPTGYLTALTAHELRIAQMLGATKTTRDTAAALFLSHETVEYHLRRVYQKLGIGSRAELADAMAAESQGRSSANRNA